jgi:hypothetical protein
MRNLEDWNPITRRVSEIIIQSKKSLKIKTIINLFANKAKNTKHYF